MTRRVPVAISTLESDRSDYFPAICVMLPAGVCMLQSDVEPVYSRRCCMRLGIDDLHLSSASDGGQAEDDEK